MSDQLYKCVIDMNYLMLQSRENQMRDFMLNDIRDLSNHMKNKLPHDILEQIHRQINNPLGDQIRHQIYLYMYDAVNS